MDPDRYREISESLEQQLRRLLNEEIDDIYVTRTPSGQVLIKGQREDGFEAHEAPQS